MPRRRRRVQDKWRMKKWYNILSPSYFGETHIGSAPCNDPNGMIGRVIEKTLYDLTDDFAHQHLKLFFKVIDVNENTCSTIFNGHEYSREYLRGLIRRRSTRIDDILNVTTKDGYTLRLTAIVLTLSRAKTTQQHIIRKIMEDIIQKKAEELTFQQFVQQVVLGKVGSEIYNAAKKITALRKCEIMKSKVTRVPDVIPEVEPEPISEAAA